VEEFSLSSVHLVGNELLDAQHTVIVNHMADVYTHLSAGKPDKGVFDAVDRLDTCCKLHFLDEERVMEEMAFPEIACHKAQHALFMMHMEHFMGRYAGQERTKNMDELVFLKGWFLEHIEVFDRVYAEYMKRQDGRAVHPLQNADP